MLNILDLKKSVLEIISDNEYNESDLIKILHPVRIYSTDPLFTVNINQITRVILEDRDGNNKFTVNDLRLLGKDIIGITSLVSSILLVLGGLESLKYEKGNTEELIFKLLIYIFLVIVPKEAGNPWTIEEKTAVLDLILIIYQMLSMSNVTKDIVSNIKEWFKKRGYCKCLQINKEEVVNEHLPKLNAELSVNIQKNKDIVRLTNELNEIKLLINTV